MAVGENLRITLPSDDYGLTVQFGSPRYWTAA